MKPPFFIRWPYRHVRNPVVLALLVVGIAAGLVLRSVAIVAGVVATAVLWHFLARPWIEAALERRYDDAYRLYRRRVRCWRPRLRGYDPAREADEPLLADERTTPPWRYVLLYDGFCLVCQAGSERLLRLARPGCIERVNFLAPRALEPFPGVPREACMRQMHLITPDGRVYGGFEAAVQALATRPVLGWVAHGYYLPGVRLLLDLLYAFLAAHRYRIMGKAADACADDTCAMHAAPK